MQYASYLLALLCLLMAGCDANDDLPGAPPVAEARTDASVIPICYGTLLLDGTGSSDPDGDSLSYEWTLEDAPVGNDQASINNSNEAVASITPNAVGVYVIRLTVSDGIHPPVTDNLSITVDVSTNNAPMADPGQDRTVPVGEEVVLDASASSDPDDDVLTYQWSFTGTPPGSQATLTDADQVQAQFTPNVSGRYVLELIVTDGDSGCSESDSAPLIITAQ